MPGRPLHALLLPPGAELYDALAAALDGGPAVLPLDPGAPPAVIERLLASLRPDLLIGHDGRRELPDPAPTADDVALVIATSGSAGRPKGVQLTAAALRHSAAAALQRLGATPGQRWLCCLPTHHIAGIAVLLRAVVTGSTPVYLPGSDPAALAGSDAVYVSLVPTMLRRALDAGVDLTGYRAILLGGAAAAPALLRQAAEAGARVVTTYGMSETAGGCVYDGLPLDGVEIAIDPDGRIRLGGPVLASGYRLDPELSASAFTAGWHLTQDAGRFAGGRLEVLGRLDDIVITGGVNVSLVQVAAELAGHPGLADAAAFGRPDAEWGQRIVAVVVPRPGGPAPALADLRDHVGARLGRASAPRELVVVAALPLLPGGKLDRSALPGLRTTYEGDR